MLLHDGGHGMKLYPTWSECDCAAEFTDYKMGRTKVFPAYQQDLLMKSKQNENLWTTLIVSACLAPTMT